MADLQKTVEIVFSGRSELGRATKSFEKEFNNLNQSVQDATRPLASMADMALKTEAALSAMVVGGMALATQQAGKFNGEFSEITTLLDETGAPIDQFRKQILDYSIDSVKSIEDINAALYAAISAGINYADSVEFIGEVEKLAVAGKGDLKSSTEVLVSTLNAYGASADEAGKYSDILFQTVRQGQTTLPELSQSLSRVTSLAAASGVPFETLSAAIATLTAKGMPTAEAMSALKGVLTGLLKPTSEAVQVSENLGIEFGAAALESKGLEGVLRDVMEAADGNVETVARLFGNVEGLSGVLSLAGEDAALFVKNLLSISNATGTVDAAYEKMAKEFDKINDNMTSNVRATLIEIGDHLLPHYTEIIGHAGGVFAGIREAVGSGAFDPIFEEIDRFGKRASGVVEDMARNLPEALEGIDYTRLIRSLDHLGDAIHGAFVAVFGEVDLSTPEGMAQALQKAVDAMTALQNITKGVIDGMRPLFAILGTGIDQFSDLDDKSAELAGHILGLGKSLFVMSQYAHVIPALVGVLSGASVINAVANLARLATGIKGLGIALASVGGPLTVAAAAITSITVAWQWSSSAAEDSEHWLTRASNAVFGLVDRYGLLTGVTQEERDAQERANAAFEAARAKMALMKQEIDQSTSAQKDLNETLSGTDTEKLRTEITEQIKKLDEYNNKVDQIPELVQTTVTAEADEREIERVNNLLIETFPDGSTRITQVEAVTDPNNLTETARKVDEAVPAEKLMKIQAELDVERIKAEADVVQTAIQWKAQLDIAEVEANAQKVESIMESVGVSIESTGDILSGLFSNVGDMRDIYSSAGIDAIVREQMSLQREGVQIQRDLADAEIRSLDARTKAMEQGKALIEVDGSGLAPHLEAIMYSILESIQIRATAEGANFLVGVT